MNHKKIMHLTVTGLMTALICVATMVIKIPTPTNGYVNTGDAFVLISGWLLGPWYGFFAGGVGSALADLISGYGSYVPGTFLIKGLMSALAAWLCFGGKNPVMRGISGAAAELWMVGGYFLYESTLLGYGLAAAASVAGNLVQGVVGVILGLLLFGVVVKTGISEKLHK